MTTHAPSSPPAAPPDSEPAWLPKSPPRGILERLRGFQPADDALWEEVWRNAAREYLGTLMNWTPGSAKAKVLVGNADLRVPLHHDMLAVIRACWPWEDYPDLQRRGLAALYEKGHGEVAVGEEWHDCLALGSDYSHIDAVAEQVHFCRRRDERAKIIKHMAGVAHSAEALDADIQRLREVK